MPTLPIHTKPLTMISVEAFKAWLKVTASSITRNITALTASGTLAQANVQNHGYQTGFFVLVEGAIQPEYNGVYLITVINQNAFSYQMDSAPTATTATGSLTVTLDDGRYATMADAASAEIENETSLFFVQRATTDVFSGTDKRAYALSKTPVQSVSSVTIDGATVPSLEYVVDADSGILTFVSGRSFPAGLKNCAVTYVAGYDDQDGPDLPSDMVRACLDLAKAIHDDLVSNAITNTKSSLGGAWIHAKRPISVQRVIDAYAGTALRP